MAEEIGAIQIGIGVNVADLKNQLKAVEAEVRATKFPEKEVPIRVRITTPSESAIRGVQNKIAGALNKAQKMQVEITPTLIASDVSAQKFIDSLTAKVAQKEIAVPVVADADPQVFRDAIMEAIGVIDVPLHWYWENGEPPSGGAPGNGSGPSSSGGAPGGGANKPSGGTGGGASGSAASTSKSKTGKAAAGAASAPQSPLASAGIQSTEPDDATWWKTEATLDDYASAVAHGVPVPYTLPEFQKIIADRTQKAAAPAQAAAKVAKETQKQAAAKAKSSSKTGAKAKAPAAGGPTPAKSAPVQPVASQPAAAPAAPAPAPATARPLSGASPLAGATPVPLADDLRPKHLPPQADPEIASLLNKDPGKLSGTQKAKLAVHKLGQHNGGGLTDLIGLGASFKNGGISFPKRNTVLGRMSEDERSPIIQAVQKYQAQFGLGDREADEEAEADRPTRSGISGRARSLAAPIGMSQEHVELNDFIQSLLDQVAVHKKSQEYRESDPVQEFKAAVKGAGGGDSGFLDVLLGQPTGLKPSFGTSPQGIPTLLPSGYDEESKPKYPNLRDAMSLLEEGGTDQARTIARFDLGRRFAQDPGYAGRLISASRGKETDAKTGQTITPAPGDEAMVAAIQSIFGEAAMIEQPRVAAVDKAYRKETKGTAAPKPTATQRHAADARSQSVRRAETQKLLAKEGNSASAGARPAMSDEYQEGLQRDQALKKLTHRYAGFDYAEKTNSPEYKMGREQAEKTYERLLKRKGSPGGVLDVLMKHRAEGGDIPGISGRARLMAGLHTALPNAKLNRKDFSDIPMDRLDRLTETMRRAGENFPGTAGSIDTLGILSNEELGKRAGMKGQGIAGITQYNPKWLLKNKPSSEIHLQREMMHGEDRHLNPDQVGFTAAHEFGHALDNYSIDPKGETQARKFSSLTGLWRPNPPTPYAETNVQENFAEIFAGQYAPVRSPRWREDDGDAPDPRQHQTDIWKDRGIWDHEGLNTLPVDGAVNMRQVIANAAKSRRYAEGGAMRHNGILGSQGDLDVTMVGERGPELIVSGKDGRTQVVPTHQVSSFLGKRGMGHHAEGDVPKQPIGKAGRRLKATPPPSAQPDPSEKPWEDKPWEQYPGAPDQAAPPAKTRKSKAPGALVGKGQERFWAKQNAEQEQQAAAAKAALDKRLAATAAADAAEKDKLRQEYQTRSTAQAPAEAASAGRGFVLPGGALLPKGGASSARASTFKNAPPAPVAPAAPAAPRPPAKAPEYTGTLVAETGSGLKGRKTTRDEFTGERAAIAAGKLSPSGGVQRVFVTNWPSGFSSSRATQGAAQGAPVQPIAGSPVGGRATPGPTPAGAAPSPQAAAQAAAKAAAQVGQVLKAQGVAAAKAAGGGGGQKAPQSTSTPLTPLEEAQLEAKTQDLITAERLKQKEISAKISASIREAPTRGVQTATGEVTAINLGGLRNVIERRRLADEASTRSTAALGLYSRAQEKVNKLVVQEAKETNPQKRAVITKKIQEQGDAVDFLQKRYEKLSDEAKTLGENVISGSDKLKVFAANTSGIIAGTFLFGGALTAVSAALGGVAQVMSPIIERMTGFQNVAAGVTNTLSDQTKASGGAVKATVELAAAQTGLATTNYDVYSNQLELRAATEAGNKSLQEQIDLFHTFQAVTDQNGGQSFDKGLVSTTGGQFGTDLFGIPSTAEAITKEVGSTLPSFSQRTAPPSEDQSFWQSLANGMSHSGPVSEASPQKEFTDALQKGQESLEFFNNQAAKGGEKLIKLQVSTDAAAIAQSKGLAEKGGLKDLAALIGEKGLVAEGATKPEDLFRYLQAVNFSGQRPNADLLVNTSKERQIPNTKAAMQAEEDLITRPQLAAQQAVDFFSNPPLPFGTGFSQVSQGINGEQPIGDKPPKKIGGELTVDQTAISSFNQYESVATAAIDAVAAKAREGEQSLRNLGVPSDVINEMKSLGEAAAGIQIGIANKQAAYDAAQYNRQLYILNRNLADAVALTGKNSGATGRLGALQREAFELSKRQQALQFQSQALSLAMSQRQINFQKALAGFQAPGETAEERAARIRQAELEANYAQKQLNIQKQLFGLGKRSFKVDVQIFDVSAQRQVQDLKFALADLQQARSLQLDTRAAEQALAAVRARQQQVNAEIGIAIEKATKKASAAINSALGIANASGEAFGKILQQTASAWGSFVAQGSAAINQLLHPTYSGPSLAGQNADRHADGALFNTMGATSMIVGEAGTETVAVLRNPRVTAAAPSSNSGGSSQIIIDVHDNTMSGAEDEERLVRQIATAVERSINRKAALISLRGT